jgi:hypothetical protein
MFGYKAIKKKDLKALEDRVHLIRLEALGKYFTELFTTFPKVETELYRQGVTVEQMKHHMEMWAADWLDREEAPWYEVYSDPAGSSDPVSRP